jgi:hypothetical protein
MFINETNIVLSIGDRLIEFSNLKKIHLVKYIPFIGDQVEFYNGNSRVSGQVMKIKGLTVTVQENPEFSIEYKMTLRKDGSWIEKGFGLQSKNRELKLCEPTKHNIVNLTDTIEEVVFKMSNNLYKIRILNKDFSQRKEYFKRKRRKLFLIKNDLEIEITDRKKIVSELL